MIHDALLILWDTSQILNKEDNRKLFANEGDAAVYANICEIAKVHHKIENFVQATSFSSRKLCSGFKVCGLYDQALSEGISEVLQSYKKSLVEVESSIMNNHSLTLQYVYSYVEKFHGLFNTILRLIVTVKERRLVGCQILSLTHQYILNGNERIHDAIIRIFSCLNKVFINQLCTWLLYGELRDPYQEFFVQHRGHEKSDTFISNPSSTNTADKSYMTNLQDTSLECGYDLNANLIPYFIPLSLAQEILFIGKTVILFGFDPRKVKKSSSLLTNRGMLPSQRYGTNSRRFTIWEDKEAEFHERLQKLKDPDELEVCSLRAAVREIKQCVTKHLWGAVVVEARLLHELRLLKETFLLGRGELFLQLLRLAAHLLDQPATRTSTRDLNHAFQLAARSVFLGSHADMDKFSFELPYVKRNASTNSLEDDSSTASDGWSSIILKYEFKWPLHLVFTPEVLARYNDLFRFLLRIKNTQHHLHRLWKTYKHSNFAMRQLHNKLMFVMDNLQHYLQADVLETNFCRLMNAAETAGDFEKIKLLHAAFLSDVLAQTFIVVAASEDADSSACINNPVFSSIMELVALCDCFCRMADLPGDQEQEDYYVTGYSDRFNKLVRQLMQLLGALRGRACGVHLARLLVRLDYNRWLSGQARLTTSITNMLHC